MENLYRTRLVAPAPKEREIAVQNPIELDNKAFNIENGDMKTLDYLDYSSTLAKGALAACGSIKLSPKSAQMYSKDYGAYSPHERRALANEDNEDCDEFSNSWDNIFLEQNPEDNFFKQAISN